MDSWICTTLACSIPSSSSLEFPDHDALSVDILCSSGVVSVCSSPGMLHVRTPLRLLLVQLQDPTATFNQSLGSLFLFPDLIWPTFHYVSVHLTEELTPTL